MYNLHMESNDIFNILHNAVEASQNGKKISHKEMAQRLGIPMRTYQDWRIGTTKPQAVVAVFQMLGMIDDDDLDRVVNKISKGLKKQ